MQFLVGSVDPHTFSNLDPDPGSQTFADPTDPDPKHCINECKWNVKKNLKPLYAKMFMSESQLYP